MCGHGDVVMINDFLPPVHIVPSTSHYLCSKDSHVQPFQTVYVICISLAYIKSNVSL